MAEPDFAPWRARIEAALQRSLPDPAEAPQRLHAAMRHGVLNGGKRMRPLLVYATGNALGAPITDLDAAAVAVELVHCYSLVHDDLPAMDDDDLRRGQPTVHVAFDEATAILAGDALQTLAFSLLAVSPLDDTRRVAMLRELAGASGPAGMCGGQAFDLAATGAALAVELLDRQRLASQHRLEARRQRAAEVGALADDDVAGLGQRRTAEQGRRGKGTEPGQAVTAAEQLGHRRLLDSRDGPTRGCGVARVCHFR